ncbi:putative Major facilitator superfamily (MFS) profile domain-containing protein [Seiridium cardinale]|uniref:Major facilitator superfamily (MFS) profile domain-containing protein n=1 Tax=Seiridium cardinale TaxID=138064 RepID=A0ABR2X5G4_9PEZI
MFAKPKTNDIVIDITDSDVEAVQQSTIVTLHIRMETVSARVAYHGRAVNHLTHGVTRYLHYCHSAECAHSGAILQAIVTDLGGDMTQGFIGPATLFLITISWEVYRAAGLAATCFWGTKFAKEPFLRRSLFWLPSSIGTYFCGAVQGLVIYGQLYYGPFYFVSVKGYSPVHTGLSLFPIICTFVPGSVLVGDLVSRLNNYRYTIWSGWVFAALAFGLMILWGVDTLIAQWAISW